MNQYFYEKRLVSNEQSQMDDLEVQNTTLQSPNDIAAGHISPSSQFGGQGVDFTYAGANQAFRTVSSSGYRERPARGNSNLMRRTGNLKDVNDVQEMFRIVKQQKNGQVDVRDLLHS